MARGLPKYAARRDSNEPEIIAVFESAGATVRRLNMPDLGDLLVGLYHPVFDMRLNLLVEVKTLKGKLRANQAEFHEQWEGQIDVARTMEDALRLAGRL